MRINQALLMLVLGLFISNIYCQNAKRPWTFLVYMAADNSLNTEADPNIAQMVQASKTQNVYILVYLNIKRNGESKITQKLIIQDGKITQDGQTTSEDSGIPATLIKALAWANQFPSDYLLVDLWDHGSGSLNRAVMQHRGVCYDDSTGHYLTDLDYKQAFDTMVNQYRGGKKIDIIAFDACLMSDIEVAYTLASYANYLVASQQTIPGPGYNYDSVLSLFAKGVPAPLKLAQWLVRSYDAYYKNSGQGYTLAATDLSKVAPCVSSLNNIASTLDTSLGDPSLVSAIAYSADPAHCQHYDEPTYLDLYTFYANLLSQIVKMGANNPYVSLKSSLQAAMRSITQAVVANARSSDLVGSHGISIYFADVNSGVEPSYNNLDWTTANPQWANFLNDYINANIGS